MEEAFTLASVEVEGFRGFNARQTFDTAADTVLLFGEQGTGKSSLLGAVEWCLFGDLAYFKSVESKTQAELVSQHHAEARCRVRVTLKKAGERLEVQREKDARSRGSHVTLRTGAQEWTDGDAEEEMFLRLGLTHEDFFRTVHLHQESIRALLTDRPEERDEAFDRMLGLEDARNLLSALPMTEVRKAVETARGQRDRIQATLEGAAKTVEDSLRRAEADATDAGVAPAGITLEAAAEAVQAAADNLAEVMRKSGAEPPEVPGISTPSDIDRAIRELRRSIGECRRRPIEGGDLDTLQTRKSDLESLRQRLVQNRGQKEDAQRRRVEWEARFGSRDAAVARLEANRREAVEIEERRRQTAALGRVIDDSLEYLRTSGGTRCPVCDQEIEPTTVLERLEEAARRHVDADSRALSDAGARLHEEERDLGAALEEWTALEEGMQGIQDATDNLERDIGALVPGIRPDLDAGLAAEVASVQSSLDAAAHAYRSREEALQAVESTLERPKAIHRVLVAKDEYERLNQTFAAETGEIKVVEDQLQDLIDLEHRLRTVSEAIAAVNVGRSAELISRAAADLGGIYGRLLGHPYYTRLEIDVKPRSVAGRVKNTYIIRGLNPGDKMETPVASRYSTGQMNCAALSLFLSLARSARHRLGFLMFDDPSQSLDFEHKKTLADAIRNLQGVRQVLLATQDREFQESLGAPETPERRAPIIYRFASWGKTGPVIVRG